MNKTSSRKNVDLKDERTSEKVTDKNKTPYHHDVNASAGGEFLDDALRMIDQPIGETHNQRSQRRSYKPLF